MRAVNILWSRLFTHTTYFHIVLHYAILRTFGCDTLIPAHVLSKSFRRVDPPTTYVRILNSYSTNHTTRSGQENTNFIVFSSWINRQMRLGSSLIY
jgi:hypothetical protein